MLFYASRIPNFDIEQNRIFNIIPYFVSCLRSHTNAVGVPAHETVIYKALIQELVV